MVTESRRQRQRARHRKRLRESRRHSYTLEEDEEGVENDDEEDAVENRQRIRIIHRERQRQQVQHRGGIEESPGPIMPENHENSFWGSKSSSINQCSCSFLIIVSILLPSLIQKK